MRISEQAQIIRAKQARLKWEISQLYSESDLTSIEILQVFVDLQASLLRYMLRIERHGDVDKEADIDHT